MANRSRLPSVVLLLVALVAIGAFFWVAKRFGSGEQVQSEMPLVICQPSGDCLWTAHLHAAVRVFQGDREVPLRFEQGDLAAEHTHSNPQTLHWHGLLPADPATKEVTDWSALAVNRLPENLKLSLSGTPTFLVNGQTVDPATVWKDGETIEIRYPPAP